MLLSLLIIPTSSPVENFQRVSFASPAPIEVRRAQAAVYRLKVAGRSFCTGFAVDTGRQKLLVSAGHCAESIKVGLPITAQNSITGKNSTIKLVKAEDHWPDKDSSIWNFLGGDPGYGLKVTDQIPQAGDEIYGIFGPKTLAPFIASGLYSGTAQNTDNPTDEINGMHLITIHGVADGASGSPVFDSQGRVWGVLVGGNSFIPGTALVVRVPQV